MIPHRIKLKGFLCYKDEQEVRFDGASLWVLSGLNGSGKSSVFDAVTYALFGYHRAGSQHAYELINKDSDGLSVEFDFHLDNRLYRARRTLRRNARGGASGTQQILRQQPGSAPGQAAWVPVEGTGQKKEFEAWIRDHVGLDYETFTSSVLLLQGKAEKLLDATAKGRFEVLAGIVDLERYERLHRRADEQRKHFHDKAQELHDKLAAIPKVDPAEWVALEEQIETAVTARQQAEAEVDRLQALEFQTRRWVELQARVEAARQRWQQAVKLLGEAADIERDLVRLNELRDQLPRVQTILEQRRDGHNAEERGKALIGVKQKLETLVGQQDHALAQTRQKEKALQGMMGADEQRQRELVGKLSHATELLTRVKEHDRQESDLTRLQAEIGRLPPDLPASVTRLRERCDELSVLTVALPILDRVRSRRDELRSNRAEEQAARAALVEITQRGERLAAKLKELKPKAEEAGRARQQADERVAEARALVQQAQQLLRDFHQLEGARTCRQCGQTLTAAHFQEELRRREQEAQALAARLQQATSNQQTAQQHDQQLREQLARVEKDYQEARDEYREQRNHADQGKQTSERLLRDLSLDYGSLPLPFRTLVSEQVPADWLTTTYPSVEELDGARRLVSSLPAAQRKLHEEEERLKQWERLKAQESNIQQTLTRIRGDLPEDRQTVRQDYSKLEAERNALERSLDAQRAELKESQREIERLGRERERLHQQLAEASSKLHVEETTRQHCELMAARLRKELPESWQSAADSAGMGELFAWQKERDDLLQAGAEERGQKLQQARQGAELFRQDCELLERQQEEFNPEARQDPAAIANLLHPARAHKVRCEEQLNEARQKKAWLESLRQKRGQLEDEQQQAHREHLCLANLTKLLGRDRLQMHLVRQAERQVVDHANAVLDRLSGGQLYLRLRHEADGDTSDSKALELEVSNRTTTDRPIHVAFLSGSQKFRVAVSLALGIGQYASRQHRPIESVIIDEGFGCLDRQGRQVMIQELQNLRSHLQCILLVSHQEEFAEAFADGYHFELESGATRVTRVQR